MEDAAFLVSVIGISNTLGRVISGWISDFTWVNKNQTFILVNKTQRKIVFRATYQYVKSHLKELIIILIYYFSIQKAFTTH